ncbi:family 43 glycosylhydrolase [Mucilaginibacter sp. HMF5004]|uniref:family 43 glycosylhydrolase n=1 Tax=Mucilaginibacter rivuli TaxID=2857527 RepID=UPI001C5F337C|nr:family 43 glycosylhydrolase [Mucilaginibacter rivuli]MBW4889975.1 family 43 glycosylhydrolase [Mucilaginibacter rivuli]
MAHITVQDAIVAILAHFYSAITCLNRPKYIATMIRNIACTTLYLCFLICTFAKAQTQNIKNDVFWDTRDGRPIYSQGGGIFRFTDPVSGVKKYYWYGVHYLGAEVYRKDPSVTYKGSGFASVTCYSSTDMVKWSFEADVLTKESINPSGRVGWVGRLGVAYIKELNKYAMFVQHSGKVLIAVADSPTGQFTLHQEISMEAMIGTSNTGDQTVFTDEDTGISYLIYSYGKGRNKIYVSEIGVKDGKVNLLDCKQVFQGASREGNCMFKYKSRYYMCASNIYGWDASFAYFLVADNIRGPYTPFNNMQVMDGCADDYAHVTQTGFFYTIKGSKQETVIYCGDRWADFAGNGLGYNQWCPLSFNGKNPYFNSLSSWNLNAQTGEWNVADDNNYVKNGSFEADRKNIPSPVKPVQKQLTGWETTILSGHPIVIGSADSIVLNHVNSEADRKIVTGEKSLNITDKVNFKRKVSQIISSSPFVQLPDGLYTLTAKVKNSKGFNKLEMYADNRGNRVNYAIQNENTSWQTISISNIPVKGGKVEIGFTADGAANAFCYVDDIALLKAQ